MTAVGWSQLQASGSRMMKKSNLESAVSSPEEDAALWGSGPSWPEHTDSVEGAGDTCTHSTVRERGWVPEGSFCVSGDVALALFGRDCGRAGFFGPRRFLGVYMPSAGCLLFVVEGQFRMGGMADIAGGMKLQGGSD